MTPQEYAALARIDTLDKKTACRVARLVVECGASVSLALSAVLDADRTTAQQVKADTQPHPRGKLAETLAVWRSTKHASNGMTFR
jgi:hypothetical protein